MASSAFAYNDAPMGPPQDSNRNHHLRPHIVVMENSKKDYSAPELRVWGSVADLTGGDYEFNGSPCDDKIDDIYDKLPGHLPF